MGFVALLEGARLSYKEKSLKRSRGRNFDLIILKLDAHVCLIKIQNGFVGKPFENNMSGRTFLQSKTRGPNFDPIISPYRS